jgi:two-component system sensor histidine kinase/response regulator
LVYGTLTEKAYQKAIDYLKIALKNDQAVKNLHYEAVVLIALSRAHLGLKDYKTAEEEANLALTRAKESSAKLLIAEALEQLVEVNKEQKKFADALKFQADYIAMNDSLDVAKTKKDVIINDLHRINADNRTLEKNNRSIASKNTDYVIVISIITILLIMVGILLILFYKRNAEKKSSNVLLQKQKQEIAEVNEELGALNEELTTQMDIVSAQNTELEKLNGVKNKFFSIVSHDLRSPLNTLKALFALYRSGDLTEKELNETIIEIRGHDLYHCNFFR